MIWARLKKLKQLTDPETPLQVERESQMQRFAPVRVKDLDMVDLLFGTAPIRPKEAQFIPRTKEKPIDKVLKALE